MWVSLLNTSITLLGLPRSKQEPNATSNAVASAAARRSLAPAVARAVRILALLEGAPQHRFGLGEIARRLNIPKSTALNICGELLDGQLLRKSQEGYQLGRRLVQLGSAYVSSVDLVREFYDVCRSAPVDLNAMIQLSVLDEAMNAVFLARQDCNSGLRLGLRAEIGRRVPANCTGSGKALLAGLVADDLEARLAGVRTLPTMTERSVADPVELRRQLDEIRKQGYAMEQEETLAGVWCVARSIRTGHREDGLLAVSVTARKEARSPARVDHVLAALFQITQQLQRQL
jgi:DNA-binding IclR family transcriptional regulator